jgi:uncharacterized protein (DUF1501 family)
MTLSRRSILRAAASAGLAVSLDGLVPVPGLGLAFAAARGTEALLVIVHLRGGCDGLNLLSPADDPDFIAARVSELRVAASGSDAGHAIGHGPAPHIDFRLHPQAAALAELYVARQLAFVHAAGLPAATRSHFVAIDMIERGVGDAAALSRSDSGWLARYLRAWPPAGGAGAVTAGPPSGELLAWQAALSVGDLNGGFGAPGGPPVEQVLGRLYAGAPGRVGAAGRQTLAAMRLIDGRLTRDSQNKVVVYQAAAGVSYDAAGDFARPLRVVAQLAKLEVGLSVATVDLGGWDTHEGQPGRFRNQVDRLSSGLAAFYNDLSARRGGLIVLVQTEFGRRLRSNRSAGTDHGRAGVMMVLGGEVVGGACYGRWPGLKADRLDEGVDLAVATDYRQVVSDVLAAHGRGVVPPEVFPGYAYPGPLGLFAGIAAPRAAPG